jgi:hypothetical protein
VRALGLGGVDLAGVPQGRVQALARFTAKARAQALDRMGPERRLAHLVAFAATLETAALDDVLDAFDLVVGELLGRAARKAERERLRSLGDLDAAALAARRVRAAPPGSGRAECRPAPRPPRQAVGAGAQHRA